MAFTTTNTASGAAALAWVFFDGMRGRKPSAIGACIGAVVGLVAITPAAGYVSVGASILIGAMAAVVSNIAVYFKSQSRLDDTLDVFPCHGIGGAFGMLATGVFASGVGLMTGQTQTFLMHLAALAIVGTFSFGGSFILYKVVDMIVPLRVSEDQEAQGLDMSQHGETMFEAEESLVEKARALVAEESVA
jgi:Amt family ammonium transporter